MSERETHLFVFRRQGVSLRFASADRDVTIGEHVYTAAQIERDAIRQTAERAKDKLKIRMAYSVGVTEPPTGWPSTQQVGNWWRPYIPSDPITVTCLSWNPDSEDPPRVEWTGWAVQPVYDDAQLELTCDPNPPAGAAGNQGPKLQRSCFKTVYSTGIRGCNLVAGPLEVAGTLSAVVGNDITAPEFADAPAGLVGVWWIDDDVLHTAAVVAQAGDTLTLDDATGLAADAEVTAHTAPQFTVRGTLTDVSGLTLTAAEWVGTPFALQSGWATWTRSDGLRESRPITAHNQATGQITLLWAGEGLESGAAVDATPNCPGTWAACAARRPDPQNHYGGAIYRPSKDPILGGESMSWG